MVHRPTAAETVGVSIWLESQGPKELTLRGDDADVGVRDQPGWQLVQDRLPTAKNRLAVLESARNQFGEPNPT